MTEKNSTEPIISIRHVWKYFGQLPALQDVSLDIAPGERVVIIGPSGSGKSTLLRSINRLEEIDGGSIIVNGQDINDKANNINEMRRNLGMVFQQFNLFPHMSILKNLTVSPMMLKKTPQAEAEAKAMQLLERVGLADRAGDYPAQLSGGQKQRVAIAGIIAMQPRCILLDEPTAMLDPRGRREVMKVLRQLNREKGITVVLITHYMEEAAECDRVIVMDDGRVLMDDTPRRVFSHVTELRQVGLDVPQTTELMTILKEAGLPVQADIIDEQECVAALEALLTR